ncbi:MAG: glycosyltransferase family 9 protein [Alphaproteobacteria bacterium]|nr:glycosyltransferase family 9 protein [Alphaproteobacteria bacterium]
MSVPAHTISIHLFDGRDGGAGPDAAGLHKILILKLGERIGDFVTAIAAFRLLRVSFPAAEITLVCLPSIVPFAASTGLFNRVVGFAHVGDVMAQKGTTPDPTQPEHVEAFKALLHGPYWLAVDFRCDESTRHWLDYAETYLRAGFAGPTQCGLDIALPAMEWDVPVPDLKNKSLPLHSDIRLLLLTHAIIESVRAAPPDAALFATPRAAAGDPRYEALRAEKRMKIGVSVGAGSELRKWPTDYWAELLQKLVATRDAVIVFFGGPGDGEESRALAAGLPAGRGVDMTATVSLDHLPAYMRLMDGYVGCDTGLTHLAAKLGVPTVDIYAGISNISVWRARGPRVKNIYAEVICAPCHLRFKDECPNKNVCMTVIMPEMVAACFGQVAGDVP